LKSSGHNWGFGLKWRFVRRETMPFLYFNKKMTENAPT
jgi:hypothetical protein